MGFLLTAREGCDTMRKKSCATCDFRLRDDLRLNLMALSFAPQPNVKLKAQPY